MSCNCGEKSPTSNREDWAENRELAAAMAWLDKRNEMNSAWLAGLIQGTLTDKSRTGQVLAETVNDYVAMSQMAAEKNVSNMSFVQTKDQLRDWHASKADETHPLHRLSDEDAEYFISHCVFFADYVEDGKRHLMLGAMDCTILEEKYGFSPEDIFELGALFGVGPKMMKRSYHMFGCNIDPGNGDCQQRDFHWCPWDKVCSGGGGRYIP